MVLRLDAINYKGNRCITAFQFSGINIGLFSGRLSDYSALERSLGDFEQADVGQFLNAFLSMTCHAGSFEEGDDKPEDRELDSVMVARLSASNIDTIINCYLGANEWLTWGENETDEWGTTAERLKTLFVRWKGTNKGAAATLREYVESQAIATGPFKETLHKSRRSCLIAIGGVESGYPVTT